MRDQFKNIEIDGQLICIGGIGKMYYQDGFPIAIAVSEFHKNNIKVSYLHIADELLKNGWPPERVCLILRTALEEDTDHDLQDMNLGAIEHFCSVTYERQRELIFEFLFDNNWDKAKKLFHESNS